MAIKRFLLFNLIAILLFAGCIPEINVDKNESLLGFTFPSAEQKVREDIINQARALLMASKYDELDRIANKYRTSKEMFPNGEWKLKLFYDSLSYYRSNPPEEAWVIMVDRLKEWVKLEPQSITARVALAECLLGYAWHGRSWADADKVKKEQWRLFFERLQMASEILKQARNLEQKCPSWWAALQRVAIGNQWERARYDKLFDTAIAYEPKYYAYYFRKAWYLLPRWYGEKGEWEQFAKSSSDLIGGREGDALYARILWYMYIRFPEELANNSNVDWGRVKKGIEVIKSNNKNIQFKSKESLP
jgi:hypothetical protein